MKTFAETQFNDTGYANWICGCATGKTLAALSVAKAHDKVLIVTVKPAIHMAWLKDINARTNGFDVCAPTTGTVKEREQVIRHFLAGANRGTKLVITNYEAAAKMNLATMKFDLVISDEVHKLKSHNSKNSIAIAKMAMDVPYKLGMTGTSWNDRPTDIYGQFRFYKANWEYSGRQKFLISEHFGNWYRFFEKYVVYYTFEKIKIPTGYRNLDMMAGIVDPHTFYIKTEDAVDIPPEQHIEYTVPMTAEMRRAYSEMEDEMIATFGEQLMVADTQLACAMRLHQLTSGVWTDTEERELYELKQGSPKVSTVVDIIDSIGTAPVVVFTRFKSDVRLLKSVLDSNHITNLRLVGGIDESVRWDKGEAQVLIVNMGAGSTGVNLQRARHAIYMSTGYSATDYEQSLWRIRRPQEDVISPVVYHHVLVEGSIDIEIHETLQLKKRRSDNMLESLTNRVRT